MLLLGTWKLNGGSARVFLFPSWFRWPCSTRTARTSGRPPPTRGSGATSLTDVERFATTTEACTKASGTAATGRGRYDKRLCYSPHIRREKSPLLSWCCCNCGVRAPSDVLQNASYKGRRVNRPVITTIVLRALEWTFPLAGRRSGCGRSELGTRANSGTTCSTARCATSYNYSVGCVDTRALHARAMWYFW